MSTFSQEHILYLKKLRREKILVKIGRFFILFAFLFLWEFLARYSILNTFLYSSPSRILMTISSLIEKGNLWKHVIITIKEVLLSFSLASIIGIFISFLLWRFSYLSKILDPYITILNSLPKVALGPLIIIWVGAGIKSIIFMALLISVFTTIIHIYTGFMSVPKHYILLLKSFHASSWQIFYKLILPYNIENMMATMKTNISLSFIGVIMGELLVSKSGLGYLIMYGSQVFQLDLVISSIFILGILSYFLYFLVDYALVVQRKRQ